MPFVYILRTQTNPLVPKLVLVHNCADLYFYVRITEHVNVAMQMIRNKMVYVK